MTDKEQFELAEKTWNEVYPDRRAFADIGSSAQNEWIKVFTVYGIHLSRFIIDELTCHLNYKFLEKLLETDETST